MLRSKDTLIIERGQGILLPSSKKGFVWKGLRVLIRNPTLLLMHLLSLAGHNASQSSSKNTQTRFFFLIVASWRTNTQHVKRHQYSDGAFSFATVEDGSIFQTETWGQEVSIFVVECPNIYSKNENPTYFNSCRQKIVKTLKNTVFLVVTQLLFIYLLIWKVN